MLFSIIAFPVGLESNHIKITIYFFKMLQVTLSLFIGFSTCKYITAVLLSLFIGCSSLYS